MRPASTSEQDEKHDEFARFCEQAGIKVDYCLVVWAGEDPGHPEGCVSAKFDGDKLTFEMLARASELFGTTKIDVGCEHGCESDRCHETYVTFWGARGL